MKLCMHGAIAKIENNQIGISCVDRESFLLFSASNDGKVKRRQFPKNAVARRSALPFEVISFLKGHNLSL